MESINETSKPKINGYGKVFFNLTELTEKTGLSLRALKYRMLEVKKKYKESPTLLKKEKREWRIHYSILHEFDPKYKIKSRTEYGFNWTSTVSWNSLKNYDVPFHLYLVNEIKKALPKHMIYFAVEVDKRGVNHTHLISEAQTKELNEAVMNLFEHIVMYKKEWQIKVEPVQDKYCLVDYLKKAPLSNGLV